MLHIALVEQESRMGGVEFSTLQLASSLDRARYRPHVIVPDQGPLFYACQATGVETVVCPRPSFRSASFRLGKRTLADPLSMVFNPLQLWRASRSLQRELHALEIDLVITKGLLAHFYGGRAARNLGILCIWHVQDEVPAERARGLYLRGLRNAANHLATAVIGDARSIAAQFAGHPRVYTVYNGIDVTEYSPYTSPGTLRKDLGIPDSAIVVGNLARLTPWKGQHVLLEAFQRLAPDFPNVHLVLVGSALFDSDHYERQLRKMAAGGPAPDRIHLAGYRTDTAQTLASMDVYVHPSLRKDTAPLALLSALSTGLPTIISDVPGMLEVIEPGQSALVFGSGKSGELTEQLRILLEQPWLRRRLGCRARSLAVERFSVEAHTRAMTAVFSETLASSSLANGGS